MDNTWCDILVEGEAVGRCSFAPQVHVRRRAQYVLAVAVGYVDDLAVSRTSHRLGKVAWACNKTDASSSSSSSESLAGIVPMKYQC